MTDAARGARRENGGRKSVQRRAEFADGQWYDSDPERLARRLDEFIGEAGAASKAIGLMAPHAGYRYSGAIAGKGYAAVDVPGTAIVLAPAHRTPVRTAAIWSGGAWETPLGAVPIDDEARTRVAEAFGDAELSTSAHDREHSLELQLPFLQARNAGVKIVPILVGTHDPATLEALGKACAAAIAASTHDRPLIVASSDMTHFKSAEVARQKDDMALKRLLAIDPDGLLEVVSRNDISMCGVAPVAAMLYAAKEIGHARADLIAYGSSGDVTGDNTSVVAYAAATVRGADA